jgi:hypothetical protein
MEEDKQWVYAETTNYILREGINSCVKGRDVEIDI